MQKNHFFAMIWALESLNRCLS